MHSGGGYALAIVTVRRASRAPLGLETLRAVDRPITARLEWQARFAPALPADSAVQRPSRRSTIAAPGRVAASVHGPAARAPGSFELACGPAVRAPRWRVIEPSACVELLFTPGERKRLPAIAAGEGLVCVLHALSRDVPTRLGKVFVGAGSGWGAYVIARRLPPFHRQAAKLPAIAHCTSLSRPFPALNRGVSTSPIPAPPQ